MVIPVPVAQKRLDSIELLAITATGNFGPTMREVAWRSCRLTLSTVLESLNWILLEVISNLLDSPRCPKKQLSDKFQAILIIRKKFHVLPPRRHDGYRFLSDRINLKRSFP